MFVRGSNPVWLFDDLVGDILNDSYYFFVLSNTFPYLPSPVWHDNQGLVQWSFPIEFLANGTLPIDIFFDPNLVYRLEIRAGNTQSDQLIYEVNNYMPGNGGGEAEATGAQSNQISNPQFAFIEFTSPLTLTSSGTYEIAPGWDLVLTGSGTATLTQLIFSGDQNLPADPVPPYAMRFDLNGWTTATLQQQFDGVGAIWSNTFVSMSVLARSNDSVARNISLVYAPNSPGTSIIINTAALSTSSYAIIQGVIALPTSTNTTSNDDAFVDMQIILPPTGIVDISDIQVMGQTEQLPIDFAQEPDETLQRQEDHLFHFYNPQLQYKQIPSYLVGWDFPKNPAQPLGPTVAATAIGANKSKYVWDQTIIFQSANSGVAVQRAAYGELQLTANVTTQMALIQYLPQIEARKILNAPICVNISALTQVVGGVSCTVSLYYTKDASLPNIATGTNNSLVATLDANGKPATFNGNWIEVTRRNKQSATFTIAQAGATTEFVDSMLNGWDLQGNTDGQLATFFAIVIGTKSIIATGTPTIGINSVGLYSGEIATRPSPESLDEVLRKCQYYYEKSYSPGIIPGTVTYVGSLICGQTIYNNGGDEFVAGKSFYLPYRIPKRVNPAGNLYSPVTGTVDRISIGILSSGTYTAPTAGTNPRDIAFSASWDFAATQNVNGVSFIVLNTTAIFSVSPLTNGDEGVGQFHYVADARLGII